MRIWIKLATVLLLVAYMLVPGGAYAADCEHPVARVVSVQGTVERSSPTAPQWETVQQEETFCANDRLRVRANSRAALYLNNDTFVRLSEQSSVTFSGLTDESSSWLDLLNGVAHFMSRVKKSFKVITPYANAAVDGTEFTLRVDTSVGYTQITVLEGRVIASNGAGDVVLEDGQSARAGDAQAPVMQLQVNPVNTVQWALYYPPVLQFSASEKYDEAMQESILAYHRGDITQAFSTLTATATTQDAAWFHYLATLNLHVGLVDKARADIDRALELDASDAAALALKSIIATVQNDAATALALATQAVDAAPQQAAPLLARSYALQARRELVQARTAVEMAISIEPDNAIAWARLSELRLMFRDLDAAQQAAQRAVELDPDSILALTALGFADLVRVDTRAAQTHFRQAVDLDQAAPLARLGLGLAYIRAGKLVDGRYQIEIAANLDPSNALIRSYLGKAYYEERRGKPAATQYALAKSLDPLDPTAWFYDAILKQSENRPIEAVADMQQSIKLNNGRAVYRSTLLLDDDLAARSVSQARMFTEIGFDQSALAEGWKSVTVAPDNFSAHRFLSDSYASLPRHNVARTSELLQAQLLAPINDTPLQPQLAEANLAILENSGPLAAAFNEYSPMFTSDGMRLQLNGLYGNNDTWGNDAVVSGIYQKLSYSLGQFHYQTDGFRDNNDNEEDIYNGFIQYAISPRFNVQGEIRRRETDQGDLTLNFDPEVFSESRRRKTNQSTFRLGGHYEPTQSSDILISYIYSDANEKLLLPFGPGAPTIDGDEDIDSRQLEAQYQYRKHNYNLVVGGGRYDVDYTGRTLIDWTLTPPSFTACPPSFLLAGRCSIPIQPDSEHDAAYLYGNLTYPNNLTWTLGIGYDSVELYDNDNNEYSPKLGMQWSINNGTRLRLAYFETVKRTLRVEQSIEPTQVAGFNQFYDEVNGSQADNYGVAIDARFSPSLYSGVEYIRRDVDVQRVRLNTSSVVFDEREEDTYRAYLNWSLGARWAVTAEYQLEKINNGNNRGPDQLDTITVPVGLNFFHPDGVLASLGISYVDQEVKPQRSSQQDSDNFALVNASLGYRLPKRYGIIGLEVRNLFDKNFSFQDRNFMTSELVTPQYIPEITILGKVTLNF